MVDAQMGNRNRGAVVSSRLQPIVLTTDLAGHNYHFWGFMLKSLTGESFKYRVMSYIHENWVQGDRTDWLVDEMALTVGSKILSRIKNPSLCE